MTETYVSVKDVMTPELETIAGLATVSQAVEHMRRNDISALIVERRGDFDEYGLITVNDIATKVIEPNLSPDRVNAYEIMTKPALTLDAKMNIRYAIRLLSRFDSHRAVVLENGHAIGVVSLRDMVLRYSE